MGDSMERALFGRPVCAKGHGDCHPDCEFGLAGPCLNETNTAQPVSELERLRAAIAYCSTRLKRADYRRTLDAILRGDKDGSIRHPDHTPVVLS